MTQTGHDPRPRAGKEQDRRHSLAVEHRCIPRSAGETHRPKTHVTNLSQQASSHRSHPALLKRLDITGARWGLDGAEAILTLRAVISNGDYPDVCVMPMMRAGPAGGHRLNRPRDRDNLRPRLR